VWLYLAGTMAVCTMAILAAGAVANMLCRKHHQSCLLKLQVCSLFPQGAHCCAAVLVLV
jgi:hypothetical protein